ncbi:zinc finger CCHC domain-containing protein 10-like [Mytilus edulis]|uniref:zinc finger CCHC domain-containing protein 10-like n=1 Tax=Mytilus edulis TaxID=6550 RepID=UPI0039EF7D8A
MVYERYCTKRTQNRDEGKQTDREKQDRYPEPNQIHTLPQNIKQTSIENKVRNDKEEKGKVISTQSTSTSAPQKTAETTANGGTFDMNSELALKRQADETTALKKMSKSAQHQAAETETDNEMSKSTQQQVDETKASNKMSEPAQQQADETTAFNKMSKSAKHQAVETETANEMS